jgi:predicted ATPase
LTDPGLVVQAIAAELDVREASDRPLADLVADRLRGKRSLLLLDNFEHVVDAAAAVAELAAVPGVQLLLTSREPLHVRGERQLPVEPLTIIDGSGAPDSLRSQAAVALFVDRARAAHPSFDLTPENARAVAEICRRLDGLPLAIELAAARASLVTPQALLERLEHALDLAVRGARDLPDRQRTLRSAIEYSYTLLPPEEQRFFAALSLFPGGATAEAADALWGDAARPALDMLESLSEKSLVRHELAPRGDVRFRMLRTIREYAGERFGELPDHADLQARRNAYFVEQLRVGGLRQFGAEHARWLGFMAEEYDNLRAVLDDVRHDPPALAAVVWGMLWSWYRRGLLSEGRSWCDAAIAAVPQPSHERGLILGAAGAITMWQGDLQLAQRRLEESIAVMREHGDPFFLFASIFVLGVVHIAQGHQVEAQPLLEEALEHFRAGGDELRFWPALTLMHLGTIELARGELARAREMLTQSLEESRRVGDPWLTASVLNNLGETARTQGDYQDAAAFYEESLREFEEAGSRGDVARSMTTLAFTACRTGDLDRARTALARATAVHRESGNKRGLAECLLGYAFVAASASRAGDAALARRAVVLVAAVDAEMEAIGARLWPAHEPERAEALVRATASLDDTAVASARQEGARLSVIDALEQEASEAHVFGA